MAVHDKYIYALGGFDGRTRQRSAERFHPVSNQWSMIQPMLCPRSDGGAATLKGGSDRQASTQTGRQSTKAGTQAGRALRQEGRHSGGQALRQALRQAGRHSDRQ